MTRLRTVVLPKQLLSLRNATPTLVIPTEA
jgi:hypothetical protein